MELCHPIANHVVNAQHVADEVVHRRQKRIVHDDNEEMGNFEFPHAFPCRTEVVDCVHPDVLQQTQMIIVTIFVPAIFPRIAWEVLLIIDCHSVANKIGIR